VAVLVVADDEFVVVVELLAVEVVEVVVAAVDVEDRMQVVDQ